MADVSQLPGVNGNLALLLRRLGIRRAVDLLFYFPRTYEEVTHIVPVEQFAENTRVSFEGVVQEYDERYTQSGKHMLGVQVMVVGGGVVRLVWFNQPFRKNTIRPGQRLIATGVVKSTVLNWEMVQPQVTMLAEDDAPPEPKPLPVYSLTEGLRQPMLRNLMKQALPSTIGLVEEALPEDLRYEQDLVDVQTALQDVHFPETLEAAMQGLRRFKFQELLVLQLAIAMQRRRREDQASAPICQPDGKVHARILARLPYELTADQQSAVAQIGLDMSRDCPMNRLLQGDVGSGKTLVAQYAMLLCVANGYQAALMAPTEVLAKQHAQTLAKSLASSRVRLGQLTGSMSKPERQAVLNAIRDGDMDLVVGTQAILSEDVVFKKLGLVIVDEQHKFGVAQRARLRSGEQQPHYLILSATPIPRTIAMTAFGDLDVSTIKTRPPGRATVHTYTASSSQMDSWWNFVDAQLDAGRQAYVIVPRVSTEEDTDALGAEQVFEELCGNADKPGRFRGRSIGLLHGRMESQETDEVLGRFARGDLQILVATTVVEVGIDVPNATVMTILDANRLGLSQLHQLRGRISRGVHPGYVCAVASTGTEISESERLQAFAKTEDGFELAELDLKMRGPGDLLGTSQSGLPTLRVASLVEDAELLNTARIAARQILDQDPTLSSPSLARLVQQTLSRYGKSMQLSDVG